jgi:hypothetical protein
MKPVPSTSPDSDSLCSQKSAFEFRKTLSSHVERDPRLSVALLQVSTAGAHAESLKTPLRRSCHPTGTFSFHATKTITTGEGGMVVTADDALAARCRTLRDHGMRKEYIAFRGRAIDVDLLAARCLALENLPILQNIRTMSNIMPREGPSIMIMLLAGLGLDALMKAPHWKDNLSQ